MKFSSWDDIPETTAANEITSKYNRVRSAFRAGKTLPLEFRLGQLRNMYYALLDNTELLKEAVWQDFRRPRDETEILELHGVFSELDEIINELPSWAADEKIWGGLKNMLSNPVVSKQPYGNVLIISPWNYPYFLSANPIATAIAAGNTVIWKPTEIAPNSSRAMAKVLQSALDPDIFQVVTGAIPESTALLGLKFDKIMLTGSTNVGKIVAQAAAKHLTPTLLELGGKSPCFISKTANLKVAARRVAWGKFVNAGQTCVAPDYMLVEESVEAEFVQELRNAVAEFYPRLSKDTETYCHIASHRMFDRLYSMIKTTNGKVELIHGEADPESRFLPPTIISGVTADDVTMQDELFGPVLPIVSVKDISKDGVDFAVEHHDCPLALYVFCADRKQADDIFHRTRSGGAIWNDTILHVGVIQAPFGGIGNSGMGAYHGKFGFDEFSHRRTILRQPFFAERLLKLRYPPYSKSKLEALTRVSMPHPWYTRDGPMRRSLIRRIFTSKLLFLVAALIGLLFVL